MNFGVLRVLNQDTIAANSGFDKHPHDNMEIITIPIEGELQHEDSTGGKGVVHAGEVQVMSAGRGITHSEVNPSKQNPVHLLQIWILPNQKNLKPRYDQKKFPWLTTQNQMIPVVSGEASESTLMIRQNVLLSLGSFQAGKQLRYGPHILGNGIYLFLIEGKIDVLDESMEAGDAAEIEDLPEFTIHFKENSKLLIMEVPLL